MDAELEVPVNAVDAAEVRGIAQEAIEEAEQAIILPRIEVADVRSSTPRPRGVHTMANPVEEPAGASPSLLSRILNHPWAVGIGSRLVVALLVTLVGLLFG